MRRLLLSIDASAPSLAAAVVAARLAERLTASLDAVYVEDINLSRLAGHPDVILIGPGVRRAAGGADVIAAALRLQETAARKGFAEACSRTALPAALAGAFRVRHGRVDAELAAAGQGFDLLAMGWRGQTGSGLVPRLLELGRRPLLLVREDRPEHLSEHPSEHSPENSSAHPRTHSRPSGHLGLAVLKGDVAALDFVQALECGPFRSLRTLREARAGMVLVWSGAIPSEAPPCSLLLC